MLLQRLGLPTRPRGEITIQAALEAMGHDKKVKDGRVRLVLMDGIGKARVTGDYSQDALAATLAEHLA